MKFVLKKSFFSFLYFLFFCNVVVAKSPDSPNLDLESLTNSATEQVENYSSNLEREQYEYEIWLIRYNKKIYEYQHTSSKVLLGISVIVLTCGLYFSYMQFKDRTKIRNIDVVNNNQNSENDEKLLEKGDDSKTSLKIGAAGIEISSSIIGLLILCVSLAFFYLYISNIYPIENSDGKNNGKLPPTLNLNDSPKLNSSDSQK